MQSVEVAEGRGVLGNITPHLSRIRIANRSKGKGKLTAWERRYAFWHEVVHGILHSMRTRKVDWRDEKFVTAFTLRLERVIGEVARKQKEK